MFHDPDLFNSYLDALATCGYKVDSNPGVFHSGGELFVIVDGRLRSQTEILNELASPISADTFRLESDNKICGKLRISYEYGQPRYQLITCAGVEQGVMSDSLVDFVGITRKRVGATSVERIHNYRWNFGQLEQ